MLNEKLDRQPSQKAGRSEKVDLCEVGPRDGFQFEKKIVPTEFKLEMIACLVRSGIRRIQIASFVHPEKVPQMADAEALFRRLPKHPGLHYSALVLNEKGLDRAIDAGVAEVEISVSASDAHSLDNSGMRHGAALEQAVRMIQLAKKHKIVVRAGIQCAFGCVKEGLGPLERVPSMVARYVDTGADRIALSDTTGMGHPLLVTQLMKNIAGPAGGIPMVLHFHDTRGLGLVNVWSALQAGVRSFDTAAGGMGGCPFVSGAAGNIATEDTAWMLGGLGFDTGIDIAGVAGCTRRLETFFGKKFPGRINRLPVSQFIFPVLHGKK